MRIDKFAFSDIPIPERQSKPRSRGINMMIDWGMGLARQADVLESAGRYIDVAKIAAGIPKGDREGAQALVTEQMLRLGVFGTPAEVIRRLETVIGGGVTHVSLGGPLGPDPAGALELLGRKVLPYFRS